MPAMQPVISREFLRSVCEPYFEQMLTAVQVALEEQQKFGVSGGIQETVAHTIKESSFQSLLGSSYTCGTLLEPMQDDASTEAEEHTAFASLLSPSSEGTGSAVVEESPPQSLETSPLCQIPFLHEDSEPSESEKNVMVCRHWRSKGWCRMEANCKFLHPENKRGVAAVKAGNGGGVSGGCMNGAPCSGISTTTLIPCSPDGDVEEAMQQRRKKRGGRGKSARTQLPSLEQ